MSRSARDTLAVSPAAGRGILVRSRSMPCDLSDSPSESSTTSLPQLPSMPIPIRAASIQFAPLPPIDQKRSKKGNKRPLGVAGRSSILRHQQSRIRSVNPHAQYANQHMEHEVHSPSDYTNSPAHMTDDDDAILELGRLMRNAGKKLWRNFSQTKPHSSRNQRTAERGLDSPKHVPVAAEHNQSMSAMDDEKEGVIDDPSHNLLYHSVDSVSQDDVDIAATFLTYSEPVHVDQVGSTSSQENLSRHSAPNASAESHSHPHHIPEALSVQESHSCPLLSS